MRDEDVEKALRTLTEGFFDSSKVSDNELKRATLEGLVKRLSPGAAIASASSKCAPRTPIPFLAEILDSHIAYMRLGALNKDTLAQFDAALAGFPQGQIDAVVLDLRGVSDGSDFETAAEFARRFAPKGKLLFSIQKPSAKQERIFTSNQDPTFDGVIVVLIDSDTGGPAEALAGLVHIVAVRQPSGGQCLDVSFVKGGHKGLAESGDLFLRCRLVPGLGGGDEDGGGEQEIE